ncbi:ABC transporter ATP-binding protein [Luxibacter massiliensis]|uniref:ABC transporter ATP-binding protein n=1 Tax=Luxibacter massiliensis TaxID=2219695 RepID=UPI000F054890|nr:ABC transporter ATP-binding protein [Luxibacter massiliensis]
MHPPVIEFSNFSFRYHDAGRESLSKINLSVQKGEFILLTGHSGCGKTTLTRCINGLIPDFFEGDLSGSCRICNMNIKEHETGDFSSLVGSVFQDPRSQFFTLHVKTEIPFPSENLETPLEKMQTQYKKSVDALEIQDLLGKNIFDLSSGEKQKVAIASIYMVGVGIYVLDEPSANLDSVGTEQLRKVLKSLKEQGNTILISEHKLYYLKGLTDRVAIMKDGKIACEIDGQDFDNRPMEWFTVQGLRKADLTQILPTSHSSDVKQETYSIKIEKLSFGYSGKPLLWHDVSFSAYGGEIVGIIGKNGAGKSTLIRTLMGLEKPKTGKILINGSYAGKQQRRKKSFYVMQDVDYQLFAPNVLEEMLMGTKKTKPDKDRAIHILERFGLSEYLKRHPTMLSGGQKQRLSIALAKMHCLPFLYLDEPTSGLDAKNMKIVQEEIKKLADRGTCVFVITHDYELAANLFTSLLLLQEDCTIRYISPDEYRPENLAQYFQISF